MPSQYRDPSAAASLVSALCGEMTPVASPVKKRSDDDDEWSPSLGMSKREATTQYEIRREIAREDANVYYNALERGGMPKNVVDKLRSEDERLSGPPDTVASSPREGGWSVPQLNERFKQPTPTLGEDLTHPRYEPGKGWVSGPENPIITDAPPQPKQPEGPDPYAPAPNPLAPGTN